MRPVAIDAFDLDDAWFKCLSAILDYGHVYTIDRGSYKGQQRLEFDFVSVSVRKPGHQIIPIMPEGCAIPAPTDMNYIQGYLEYLMTGSRTDTEDYTYGERLVSPKVRISCEENGERIFKEIPLGINQIEEVIRMYREDGEAQTRQLWKSECLRTLC